MKPKIELLLLFLAFVFLFVFFTATTQARSNFDRVKAAQAAAKQGWPGYPDDYQSAFVEGARWQSNQ